MMKVLKEVLRSEQVFHNKVFLSKKSLSGKGADYPNAQGGGVDQSTVWITGF